MDNSEHVNHLVSWRLCNLLKSHKLQFIEHSDVSDIATWYFVVVLYSGYPRKSIEDEIMVTASLLLILALNVLLYLPLANLIAIPNLKCALVYIYQLLK